jgi:hypothetical protein
MARALIVICSTLCVIALPGLGHSENLRPAADETPAGYNACDDQGRPSSSRPADAVELLSPGDIQGILPGEHGASCCLKVKTWRRMGATHVLGLRCGSDLAIAVLRRPTDLKNAAVLAKSEPFTVLDDWWFDLAAYRLSDSRSAFGVRFHRTENFAAGGYSNDVVLNLFSPDGPSARLIASLIVERHGEVRGDWQNDGTRPFVPLGESNVIDVTKSKTGGVFDWKVSDGAVLKWNGIAYDCSGGSSCAE